MSYQPPAGMPPQAPPPGMAPQPMPQPMPQPVPSPMMRKDAKALVAALLGLVAVVLLIVSTMGHTWLRPEEAPDELSGGMGLWSTVMEGPAGSIEQSHSDLVSNVGGGDEDRVKAGLFAYGSMAFFILNWLLIAVLALAVVVGFMRWAGGKPAGVPFALTLIPSIVGFVGFLAWFGVSVLLAEVLDGSDIGGMIFVWWTGLILAFVAAILYAKVRSAAAFGAGFHGTGGMMPPGAGVVGPQMLPPGQGVIQNPADSIGRPQG